MKAIPINPVMMKVIPSPLNGAGTFEYLIFSRIAAIATIAKNQPTPEPKPNTAEVEATGWGYHDLLSNGFKMRGTDVAMNASGNTYIYMAFGQTLVGTNNIPNNAE